MLKKFCKDKLGTLLNKEVVVLIENYQNSFHEISCFQILLADYQKLVNQSLEILENLPVTFELVTGKFSMNIIYKAKQEMIKSFQASLHHQGNLDYSAAGSYAPVLDRNGHIITGIKLHASRELLHVEGILLGKRVIRPGCFSPAESSPITQAKEYLKQLTPLARWRQFRLDPNQFSTISANNRVISNLDVKVESGPFQLIANRNK